jgi:Holliday junction resolvasome RuvABC DNA-binding subunit
LQSGTHTLNLRIARRLEEVAEILSEQHANSYRVRAYRKAATTLRGLSRPVSEIFKDGGEPALRVIPGIGPRLARAIASLILTGRLPMLDRLRGESDHALLLASVPGIGQVLAGRLHDELHIHTLEQLEAAAHDGRLRDFLGLGEKRIAGIMDSLASRLGRIQTRPAPSRVQEPPVAEILDVDREYREKAASGTLPTIAPRRFNPSHEAWLPILHTERGRRHYTVVFSNTAHAHQLEKTRDWVILYYDSGAGERQCTVITSQRGPLAGRRIVRGREEDCITHYRRSETGDKIASGTVRRFELRPEPSGAAILPLEH